MECFARKRLSNLCACRSRTPCASSALHRKMLSQSSKWALGPGRRSAPSCRAAATASSCTRPIRPRRRRPLGSCTDMRHTRDRECGSRLSTSYTSEARFRRPRSGPRTRGTIWAAGRAAACWCCAQWGTRIAFYEDRHRRAQSTQPLRCAASFVGFLRGSCEREWHTVSRESHLSHGIHHTVHNSHVVSRK